jgi:hypothetical protein
MSKHLEERQILFDVFKFIEAINPDTSVSWLATEVTTATGVSGSCPGFPQNAQEGIVQPKYSK